MLLPTGRRTQDSSRYSFGVPKFLWKLELSFFLLGAKGIATRSKGLTSNKKLVETRTKFNWILSFFSLGHCY